MSNSENEKIESESNDSEETIAETMNRAATGEEESISEDEAIQLAEIAKDLPKSGNSLLITNLLKIFREFAANPNDKEKQDKVEIFIDEQIDRLSDVIEKYSSMAIPPDGGEIHQKVMDSLAINYEGLFNFKDLFINLDINNIRNGFDLLIEADDSLAEIETDLRKQVNEMVITTIL